MRRKDWPRKSGLGLGLGVDVGGGGRDEALYAGTGWTYDYTTGIWTPNPTLGSQIHTQANAASDPNGNEANATTGWTNANSNFTSDNADPSMGSFAFKCETTGVGPYLYYAFTATAGTWYSITGIAKNSVAALQARWSNFGNLTAAPDQSSYYLSTAYANRPFTVRATGAAASIRMYGNNAVGDYFYLDNVGIKPISSGLFCLRKFIQQTAISAKVSMSIGYQGGVVSRYSDANNFVFAYYNRCDNKTYIGKCVTGTYTEAGTAVAYAANTAIEIRWADANTAQLYYGGAQKGADLDVTGMASGNYSGMIATSSNVTFNTITHTP